MPIMVTYTAYWYDIIKKKKKLSGSHIVLHDRQLVGQLKFNWNYF